MYVFTGTRIAAEVFFVATRISEDIVHPSSQPGFI